MKLLPIAVILFLILPTFSFATDPYFDGYNNTMEGYGHWSDSNNIDYQYGYDDAKMELERRQRWQEEEEEEQRRIENAIHNSKW